MFVSRCLQYRLAGIRLPSHAAHAALTPATRAASMATPVRFPDAWTAEDQLIIETLLFCASPIACAASKEWVCTPNEEQESSSTAANATKMAQRWRLRATTVGLSAPVDEDDGAEMREMLARRSVQRQRQVEERRKIKHRAVQRRFMQRKKEQGQRMKQELARLETEHDVLRLASAEQRLAKINHALREELETKEPVPFPTGEQVQALLKDQLELIRSHYEPLTTDEWKEIQARTLREMEAAGTESGFESTGAVVMGWSDERKVDYEAGCSKFVLSKTFPHLDALSFRDLTWEKLQLEDTHKRLFHPAVAIRAQVLQRLDENGVVLHRVMFNPVTGGVVHAIEATMRSQSGRDLLLIQRALDYNAAFECVPKSHKWMRLVTSLIYSPVAANGGCVFRYAGILKDLAPADVRYWLMEMLWVILRLESVMVAPLFSLTRA